MLKAVIFDFDGVIADTYELNLNILRNQGRPDLSEETFKDHHNGNVFEKPGIDFDEEQTRDFYEKYYASADPKYIFPLHSYLQELACKYGLYVVTSNAEKTTNRFIAVGGLDGLFTDVLGVESGRSKTHKFNLIFSKYSVKATESVFVTDTSGDVLESKSVGMATLGVAWGYHGERRLRRAGANEIIHEFNELIPAIEKFD